MSTNDANNTSKPRLVLDDPTSSPSFKMGMTFSEQQARIKKYSELLETLGKGFNELRFEDAGGREEVYLHAQRDHRTHILNDEFHTINHSRQKKVGVDQQEKIGNDKRTEVGRDHYEKIERNSVIHISQDQKIQIDQNKTEVINSSKKPIIFSDQLIQIGGQKKVIVEGNMHEEIKTKLLSQSPLYIIHAEKKLTLAGSGGSIIIDDIGITIKAKQLKIFSLFYYF